MADQRFRLSNAVEIVVSEAAVSHLLKVDVVPNLQERAERIAGAAGPGNEVEMFVGRNRARATIRTVTTEAMLAEATTRDLTRAIDAGR